MAKIAERSEPTPNGGVRSRIAYLNDAGDLVDESVATAAEIVEFDAAGEQVFRTYLERCGGPSATTPKERAAAVLHLAADGDQEAAVRLSEQVDE